METKQQGETVQSVDCEGEGIDVNKCENINYTIKWINYLGDMTRYFSQGKYQNIIHLGTFWGFPYSDTSEDFKIISEEEDKRYDYKTGSLRKSGGELDPNIKIDLKNIDQNDPRYLVYENQTISVFETWPIVHYKGQKITDRQMAIDFMVGIFQDIKESLSHRNISHYNRLEEYREKVGEIWDVFRNISNYMAKIPELENDRYLRLYILH